jgi:hypothetical protein
MATRTFEQWVDTHKCRLSDGAASGESLQRFMKIAWDAAIAENAEALNPSPNTGMAAEVAQIAAQMEQQLAEVSSGTCVYKNWPIYVEKWARQLRHA